MQVGGFYLQSMFHISLSAEEHMGICHRNPAHCRLHSRAALFKLCFTEAPRSVGRHNGFLSKTDHNGRQDYMKDRHPLLQSRVLVGCGYISEVCSQLLQGNMNWGFTSHCASKSSATCKVSMANACKLLRREISVQCMTISEMHILNSQWHNQHVCVESALKKTPQRLPCNGRYVCGLGGGFPGFEKQHSG